MIPPIILEKHSTLKPSIKLQKSKSVDTLYKKSQKLDSVYNSFIGNQTREKAVFTFSDDEDGKSFLKSRSSRDVLFVEQGTLKQSSSFENLSIREGGCSEQGGEKATSVENLSRRSSRDLFEKASYDNLPRGSSRDRLFAHQKVLISPPTSKRESPLYSSPTTETYDKILPIQRPQFLVTEQDLYYRPSTPTEMEKNPFERPLYFKSNEYLPSPPQEPKMIKRSSSVVFESRCRDVDVGAFSTSAPSSFWF